MTGQTISHYRILDKLGEGGMGVVYRAEDTRLHRTVALKFLRAEALESQELRTRFRTEAEAAAALIHPNICVVHEIDEDDGKPFIAMEHVEGQSLKQKIGKRPLPLEEALDIAVQVAEGLHAAHKKGIVHRDIKSANVMIDGDGRAKIMDFGLARLKGGSGITQTGSSVGTPAYMSPEQVQGDEVDQRADIWSLGVVLYGMIAGQLPFKGEVPEAVSHSILYEEPESLTALRAGVPLELDRVVGKALAKDPGRRYQHVDEILVDLRAVSRRFQAEEGTPAPRPAERGRKTRVLVHAGILMFGVLLVVLGFYLVRSREASSLGMASIAVLPLDNLSNNPEEDYFTDGLTEALIADLAKIGSLTVISRTSVMRFRDSERSLPEIARQLNVAYIVEGSALRVGNRVRITAQLIEASADKHRWVETYDRDVRDILALQSEVARTIAQEIKVRLTPDEEARLATTPQVNADAYEAYLRGRFFWYQFTAPSVQKSMEYFEQAVALDPEYAPAYAGLAMGYRALTSLGIGAGKELLPKARGAGRKALELDDALAESHMAEAAGASYEWNWPEAERAFQRTFELNPSYSQAHAAYAMLCLVPQGRLDEALSEARRSVELDPLAVIVNAQVGQVLLLRREYDEAIKQSRQTLEMDPNLAWTYWILGRTYLAAGRHDEALAALRRAVGLSESSMNLAYLGHAYGVAGDRDEAEKILERLRERPPAGYVSRGAVAFVYLGLGEQDRAFEWLELAHEQADPWLMFLKVDPAYDGVRSDPRFTALLRKVNLEP